MSSLTLPEIDRRQALKYLAASIALASGACSGPPAEKIVPFVRAPEELLPGKPVFYATTLTLGGYGMGVLVESNGGRPTKVEGNPAHPASLGSTDMFAQAAVLDLWDPARSQAVLKDSQISSWDEFLADLEPRLSEIEKARGAGLYILTGTVTSPTLQSQLRDLKQHYPQASLHQYDPLHCDNALKGSQQAFGRALDARYRFDRAQILLTLDADFLSGGAQSVRYARDFTTLRDPDRGKMSRVYSIESGPGLIGAKADHRLALSPPAIEAFLLHLAKALGVGEHADKDSPAPRFEAALLDDFRAHPGASLIVPGESLRPELHALVHALNHRLGGLGNTYEYSEPVAFEPVSHVESIRNLAAAMDTGAVHTLVVLGGNPVYDAPADLQFAARLAKVQSSVHLGLYADETAAACRWHIPSAHALEAWSDARAFDGTASIVQPLIAPLYGGHSAHELLNVILRQARTSGYESVRAYWQRALGEGSEEEWRKVLREGVIANTRSASVRPELVEGRGSTSSPRTERGNDTLIASFVPDQSVRDGSFANNAWLQEIPRSMSKLTWGNAAYISPRTASRLQLTTGDEVALTRDGRAIVAGIWILPGHADETVTLPLGYGRKRSGPVGTGVGFDAYQLRTSDEQWYAFVEIARTGTRVDFATTQNHARMEGRSLVRKATAAEFASNPRFATAAPEERIPEHTLYPDFPYDSYKWGMSIDLGACIGCNACTIACQAENNIPTVGQDQVRRGREMHWIRVDRYDEEDGATTDFQPVPCMHCEHAPCEEVCPVGATVHDSQGLNVQVYNRCVGTRFCSNNCPYKVRRFNFLQYSNLQAESLKALANPDVTVRQRGVMEKCSYCIQRIQRGRISAQELGRRLRDGEVVTACQAACPTQAITFGDLNDRDSAVNKAKASPRDYALLAELNTRPRTTYRAIVTNPKPGFEPD